MYLASATRLDISFAVCKLKRFVSLGDDHWKALERVMPYLKSIMDYEIHYTPRVLEGYNDQIGSHEINTTSGYVFTLGGGVVS